MLQTFFLFYIKNTTTSCRFNIFRKVQTFQNNAKFAKQYIISSRNNNIYSDNEAKLFIDENKFLADKKLITISPGGFKGFYLLGILTYIKENYNTDQLIYSGASAGAWNGLFMCYKGDSFKFVYNLLDYNIKKAKSITELEYSLKYKILSKHKDSDFDLDRLFIGVTTVQNLKPRTNIFADFETLEDAINCCFASSHIPFITGGITNKYHNMFTFDGGFSKYPYLDRERLLHVSPSMWREINKEDENRNLIKNSIKKVKNLAEIFSISKNNLLELFDDGFHDAKKNKQFLDSIFVAKPEYEIDSDVIEI
jgi:predicted patatin/cPLA2 family phospholipase